MAVYASVDDALVLIDRLGLDGLQEALFGDLHQEIIAIGNNLRVVVDALREASIPESDGNNLNAQ